LTPDRFVKIHDDDDDAENFGYECIIYITLLDPCASVAFLKGQRPFCMKRGRKFRVTQGDSVSRARCSIENRGASAACTEQPNSEQR